MKMVLCDDQKSIFDGLKVLIDKFSLENNIQNDIIYFEKPSELYEYMQENVVDIIFMDLEFCDPAEDGILWSKKIKKQFPSAILIILTNYENRYKEGFEARVFRFMTKPIEEAELFDYLCVCMEELQLVGSIALQRRGMTHNIILKDICYFAAQSGGSEIWTKNDMYCCEESLLQWEKQLPSTLFFRCHSKYIVNMSHIVSFDKQIILLDNGEKIPVSRRRWKSFQLAYMKYDTKSL